MSTRADRLNKAKEEGGSKLKCKKPDCKNEKHSYLEAPKQKHVRQNLLTDAGMQNSPAVEKPYAPGRCWACGDTSVSWEVTQARDVSMLDIVVELLQFEKIRFDYWNKPFDESALARANRDGFKITLRRLERRFGTVSFRKPANGFDGRQTPWEGDVIFYAQHATGTCCRTCIERWHGIPKDQVLSDQEIGYLVELSSKFLEIRRDAIWRKVDEPGNN